MRRRFSLALGLERAGLSISPRKFVLLIAAIGLPFGLIIALFMSSMPLGIAATLFFVFVLPASVLRFLATRRVNRLIDQLPGALETLVRGTRSGMSVTDSMNLVASDFEEPIAGEFKRIVEAQMLSFTVTEAVARMAERTPKPEIEFFASAIAIQQRTGGNLSDALSSLAKLLRDRKNLREKVNAISKEAKSSAAIIGSLPVFVVAAVSVIAPSYMAVLWYTPIGPYIIAGCLFWMGTGVLIMRKMINFKI